jgi:hypothetical protein
LRRPKRSPEWSTDAEVRVRCSRRTVREVRDGERGSPDAVKPLTEPLWMAQLDWPSIIHELGMSWVWVIR